VTTLRGLVFLIAVSIAGSSDRRGAAQQTPSSPIGSSSASVRLEPHEGKVQFRLGDPIALDLVLAAESGGYQTFLESSRIDSAGFKFKCNLWNHQKLPAKIQFTFQSC
jgi:hypothetical protein